MRNVALVLLLALLPLGSALAEEAPTKELKRGFDKGAFVDEYFGIQYAVDGLEEGFGFGAGGDRVLFSGKLPGNADVEILCNEQAEALTSAQWRDKAKAQMEKDDKTRTEMATGDDPAPWITFIQESFAGFERPHGYVFHARGHQCFVVHVQVREKSDASAEIVRKALAGLKVAPSSDSLLIVHIAAKRMRLALDDPKVLIQAAQGYLQEGHEIPELAVQVLERAKVREDELDDNARYVLHRTLAMALLTGRKLEAAVAEWRAVVELAQKADNPAVLGNAFYNLACALSLAGKIDEGLEALKGALENGSESQISQLKEHAQEDTDLEKLRADPRFAELTGETEEE